MPTATQRTRVVFAAHAFPRGEDDLPGSFLLRLAVALEREGIEVRAVAPAASGLPPDEVLRGIPVHRYRYAPRRAETLAYTGGMHRQAARARGAAALAGLIGAGALAVRRAGAAADLVHAHWWFPGGVQGLLAGRRPLVTTLHGTDLRLTRSRPVARVACARVLRASAVITTVSTWLRDEVAEFAPDCAARTQVAPMPVDDSLFSPGGQPRTELLFVGRLDRQKGADLAIRAVAALRGAAAELQLRLVGSGPLEPELRRLAGELGIAERLRWESGLSQPRLADRYRRAAALVVPGAGEGFGLVAVEGQLSGAPVVAAASGGLLDVVADARTGWTFPPGDPAKLAKVVEEIVDHPDRAAEVAGAARRAASRRFSTTAAATTYAALYREAVGAAGPGERAWPPSDRLADAGAGPSGPGSGGAGGAGSDEEPGSPTRHDGRLEQA
jgi:glycosyltransferase involved in cell wall biosynthesis